MPCLTYWNGDGGEKNDGNSYDNNHVTGGDVDAVGDGSDGMMLVVMLMMALMLLVVVLLCMCRWC